MTVIAPVASIVWGMLKFLHNWDVILRQHSPHIHFSQHWGHRLTHATCLWQISQHIDWDWVIFLNLNLNFTILNSFQKATIFLGSMSVLICVFFVMIRSRYRFQLLRHGPVNAKSSSWLPSVGDFLLAPPQIPSRWNLSHCDSFSFTLSPLLFYYFRNLFNSAHWRKNLNLPDRFMCWQYHEDRRALLVSSSQLSVRFSLPYIHATSRTFLWTSSVIWLLAGTLDMASFYFPEHMKTLENSRRLVSSKQSLACFTQTWHDMKACLSGGCWTGRAALIGFE